MHDNVPVLLLIFNRPDKTRRVVEALRRVKPSHIAIAADGPRPEHGEDIENCRRAREVACGIDWPCHLKTLFLDSNLGCGAGVSSGITWFFNHVERGVILEDDCIPHPDFFRFCSEMLERYADDERIMQVSGLSPYVFRNHAYDYHFTRAFRCWGWATWRRAWRHFSLSLEGYPPEDAAEFLRSYFPYSARLRRKITQFEKYRKGVVHNWDVQWNIACYSQNGLCIVPEKNLITNIGFDHESTHTTKAMALFSSLTAEPLDFPLRHPHFVYADGRPEDQLQRHFYKALSYKQRCGWQLRRIRGAVADMRQM